MKLPNYLTPIYTREQISQVVAKLGKEITSWIGEDEHVISVPILRGSIFFFADLLREIDVSLEISPVRTWGYIPGQNDLLSEDLKLNLYDLDVKDKRILLVDDLCDSGRTLQALSEAITTLGAREVKSAVLIQRIFEDQCFQPDFTGFHYQGSEWFIGYGMEDQERYRNLPDIYLIGKN